MNFSGGPLMSISYYSYKLSLDIQNSKTTESKETTMHNADVLVCHLCHCAKIADHFWSNYIINKMVIGISAVEESLSCYSYSASGSFHPWLGGSAGSETEKWWCLARARRLLPVSRAALTWPSLRQPSVLITSTPVIRSEVGVSSGVDKMMLTQDCFQAQSSS